MRNEETLFNYVMEDNVTYWDTSYKILVFKPELDLLIRTFHIYRSGVITFTDLIKMLAVRSDFSFAGEILIVPPTVLIQSLFRIILRNLRNLIIYGRVKIPFTEKSIMTLRIVLGNLRSGNTNFKYYYTKLRDLALYAFRKE